MRLASGPFEALLTDSDPEIPSEPLRNASMMMMNMIRIMIKL